MTTGRSPHSITARAFSLIGDPIRRRLAQWRMLLPIVNGLEDELSKLSDRDMRKRSLALRYRAKSGERLDSFVHEAFALVRESARRTIGMRHFDVQILGGLALFNGSIAEMETGEGKTLTATLPLYIHSLLGKGAHLATVNDYLAKRDADWMRPVYELLGLTVGVIQTPDTSDQRREAYGCDITYGTAKEFGFDFLRDRLLLRRMGFRADDFLGTVSGHRFETDSEKPVQRGSHFGLVDEADSILIDEARTPLIIGSLGDKAREQVVSTFRWAAEVGSLFVEDEHYEVDHDTKKFELTGEGRQLVRSLPKPAILGSVGLIDLHQYVERAAKVIRDFHLNQQYVVRDGEIVIVDEFTGRLAEGRKWRDGIHQALEAKEKLEVTVPTGQAARITVQDLFLRYHFLAGMTGTARTSAREFHKIYKTRVIPIPTNRPIRRQKLPARVYADSHSKWAAIVAEVSALHRTDRPVLIGTRSIDKSQLLSKLLSEAGLAHQVLNANEIAKEAEIVARAGEPGKITVATNMAGRGTDIKLADGVAETGGLAVICSEFHDAARIDRQLAGRCGRQGDPGTVYQFLAVDDEILRTGLGPDKATRIAEYGKSGRDLNQHVRLLRKAQKKVERRHFRDRMVLLHYEKERKKIQREMGQDPYLDTPD